MSTHNNSNYNGVEVFPAPTTNNTHNTGDNNMYGNGEAYTPIQHEETFPMLVSDWKHIQDKMDSQTRRIVELEETVNKVCTEDNFIQMEKKLAWFKSRVDLLDEALTKAGNVYRETLLALHENGCMDDMWGEIRDQIDWFTEETGMTPFTKKLRVEVTYTVKQSGTVDIPFWMDADDFDSSEHLDISVESTGEFIDDYDNNIDVQVVDTDCEEWDCD